jgi:Na+-driven multidrug efflux pump
VLRHLIPSVATMYLKKAIPIINLIYVGNYGTKAMIAGVGMGNMINNVCGSSIFIGVNMAVETFVS